MARWDIFDEYNLLLLNVALATACNSIPLHESGLVTRSHVRSWLLASSGLLLNRTTLQLPPFSSSSFDPLLLLLRIVEAAWASTAKEVALVAQTIEAACSSTGFWGGEGSARRHDTSGSGGSGVGPRKHDRIWQRRCRRLRAQPNPVAAVLTANLAMALADGSPVTTTPSRCFEPAPCVIPLSHGGFVTFFPSPWRQATDSHSRKRDEQIFYCL